jgi:hypothetical protein
MPPENQPQLNNEICQNAVDSIEDLYSDMLSDDDSTSVNNSPESREDSNPLHPIAPTTENKDLQEANPAVEVAPMGCVLTPQGLVCD